MNADTMCAQWHEQRDAVEAASKAGGGALGIVRPDGKFHAHATTTNVVFATKLRTLQVN